MKIVGSFQYTKRTKITFVADDQNKIYIPREDIQEALKYRIAGQMSKVRARYKEEFEGEYLQGEHPCPAEPDGEIIFVGLYTVKAAFYACSHAQRWRDPDIFAEFLSFTLGSLKESCPEINFEYEIPKTNISGDDSFPDPLLKIREALDNIEDSLDDIRSEIELMKEREE